MKLNDFVKSHPGVNTAFGVVFAIIAGLLLLGYLSRAARGGDGGPILEIPVASRDIAMGAATTWLQPARRLATIWYRAP